MQTKVISFSEHHFIATVVVAIILDVPSTAGHIDEKHGYVSDKYSQEYTNRIVIMVRYGRRLPDIKTFSIDTPLDAIKHYEKTIADAKEYVSETAKNFLLFKEKVGLG